MLPSSWQLLEFVPQKLPFPAGASRCQCWKLCLQISWLASSGLLPSLHIAAKWGPCEEAK